MAERFCTAKVFWWVVHYLYSMHACCVVQVLLTYKGQDLAVIEVESKWAPNKTLETKLCYGTSSLEHPGTLFVATERGKYYIGGKVFGLDLPTRYAAVYCLATYTSHSCPGCKAACLVSRVGGIA